MHFYDRRHTAISMALHSTLVIGSHGMNLHNLAGWTGHDVIARYFGEPAIGLDEKWAAAREWVESEPYGHLGSWAPAD